MASYITYILVALIGLDVMAGHWDSFCGSGMERRETKQESALYTAFGLSSCYP